jgi:zinc/manganese transport system substrate-binding protein
MRTPLTLAASLAVLVAACGGDDQGGAAGDRPQIVVTTTILGDVVEELVGELADVTVVMPIGASPHDFAPSAQQVNDMAEADAVILNGAGFEEGLLDSVESIERDGVPTYEAIAAVDTLSYGDEGEHADEDEHVEEGEHDDEDEHARRGVDPHFFTDPVRMADAAQGIADFLADEVAGLGGSALEDRTAGYLAELDAVDGEIRSVLDAVPVEDRVLVTNHEVFAYFADRYDFEVVGTVIPGGTVGEETSGGDLAELADVMRREGVRAVFGETSAPARLAETLADEVGAQVEVVELFTESLGEPGSGAETYVDLLRTDAERIATALA